MNQNSIRNFFTNCLFVMITIGLGFNSTLAAQDEKTEEKKEETTNEKTTVDMKEVSYVIGASIGRNIASQKIEIDIASFTEGLSAALKDDGKLKLTDEEMQAVMTAFSRYQQEKAAEEKMNFLVNNKKKEGVKVTESGLQYRVLKSGADGGKSPGPTDQVTVHYHGTLTTGEVFDSSVQRGEPSQFGVNQVIPGWTEALQLMKEGDKWEIVLPPEIAYGERGAGGMIGPNEVLVFEVELIKINK